MIGSQARAILWAQTRALANYYFRRNRGVWFGLSALLVLLWYALWVLFAGGLALIAADPSKLDVVSSRLPGGLLLVFCYWQIVPMIMVSTGLSLDLARLLVYPVPHAHLFGIEVLLRITTAIEMMLVCTGLAVGLALNPRLPFWAWLALPVFAVFNLLFSAGLRDLFARLMTRKYFREALVFFLVLLAALPQVLVVADQPAWLGQATNIFTQQWWPWSATAAVSSGGAVPFAAALLIGWTALAWLFGRWQFDRSLRFDAAAARSAERSRAKRGGLAELLAKIPNVLFRDPMAALVEKEIRFLSRAPRFRLLFLMGFSFGLLIWLPVAMRGDPESTLRTNYLTVVSAYALMLLGEVAFWNIFGMDRAAAQTYFVTPIRISTVLAAKNFASALFISLEIGMVAFFCLLLRMPVTVASVAEALTVTGVTAIFLFSAGNMLAVRNARGVDPSQSWRTSNVGKTQAVLFILYPIVAAPAILAYGARYAFEDERAFWGVLLLDVIIGAIVYSIALESAAGTAFERKEELVQSLSATEGPVGG